MSVDSQRAYSSKDVCDVCLGYMNLAGDIRTKNCGGTCLMCMASAGDPDAIDALKKARARVVPWEELKRNKTEIRHGNT